VADPKSFLRFDGRLWENMNFERRPGWETERVAHPRKDGDQGYALDLLDEEGRLLVSISPDVDFDRATTSPMEEMRSTRVIAYVPFHSRARQLVFHRGDIDIHREDISAEPPEVRLGTVRRRKDGSVEFRWTARHKDKRPLTFNVVYLADNNRSFQLARGLTETRYTADLAPFPGSKEGRFAVLATDGTRSSFAVSDPIAVADKEPRVWINAPADGDVLPPDQPVTLRGLATDIAGAGLPEHHLRWWVDRKQVAHGQQLALAEGLTPGRHTVLLEYAPSGETAATAQARFEIAPRNNDQQRYNNSNETAPQAEAQ